MYALKDHLGNVRSVVSDIKAPIAHGDPAQGFNPIVRSQNDYYPFGMQIPGRIYNSSSYRYGFQRQEKDDEIKGSGNSINYKYRMHDPRLGRFLSLDPLAPDYPYNSPYAFSENRVIDAVELEGLEKYVVHKQRNKDGTTVINVSESGRIDGFQLKKPVFDKDGKLIDWVPLVKNPESTYVIEIDEDGNRIELERDPAKGSLLRQEKLADPKNKEFKIGKQTIKENGAEGKSGNRRHKQVEVKTEDPNSFGSKKFGCTSCDKTGTFQELENDPEMKHDEYELPTQDKKDE
jgi:RHS repeat-associated protein